VHVFAHPSVNEELDCFFTDILLPAPTRIEAPGLEMPVLVYCFSNGASMSVQFSEDALRDEQARRGAWLELVVAGAAAAKNRVSQAGLRRVDYKAMASSTFRHQAAK
jgi:hypothetical protein